MAEALSLIPPPLITEDKPNERNLADQLAKACTDGGIGKVKELLKLDRSLVNKFTTWSSPDYSHDMEGELPIIRALYNENWHIADYLLHSGADVNAPNNEGSTPLQRCTEFDTRLEAVRWLLQNGARLEERDDQGRTALFCAVRYGSRKIVSLLLSRGANVDASDLFGRSVLHIAAAWGQTSIIEELSANEVNVNIADRSGNTPLMHAAQNGHAASVRALIMSGAKVNEKGHGGRTALHHAAQGGFMEIASMLTRHHASKDVADTGGTTPLDLAAKHGPRGVIQAFIANPSEENSMLEIDQAPFFSVPSISSPSIYSVDSADELNHERPFFETSGIAGLNSEVLESIQGSRLQTGSQDMENPGPYDLISDTALEFEDILRDHRDYQHEDQVPFQHARLLGDGAFARVDAVLSQSVNGSKAGRLFARKVIFVRPYSELLTRENIEKEVSILRKLQHPHIISIVTTYTQPNPEVFAMIMHPVADCHLGDFLNRCNAHRDTDLKKLSSWFGCLAMGLEYLHSCGIRHKDIKPENLLVHGDNILFADFGLSRDCLDETSTTSGPVQARTAMYCAPEVANEERRGKSSDVFSLGCCFLEMTTLLCGKTLDTFRKFRETDGRRAYHTNIRKVLWWIQLLAQDIKTEFQSRAKGEAALEIVGEPPHWYYHQSHLLLALEWCYSMLQPKKEKRINTKQLLLVMKCGTPSTLPMWKFYGDCCEKAFLEEHNQLRIRRLIDWAVLTAYNELDWDEMNARCGYNKALGPLGEFSPMNSLDSKAPLSRSARVEGGAVPDAQSSTSPEIVGRLSMDRNANYSLPDRPWTGSRAYIDSLFCPCCKTEGGFKGQVELLKHVVRIHSSKISEIKFVCIDGTAQALRGGGPLPTFRLGACKRCVENREYESSGDAASHLREFHFCSNPRKRKRTEDPAGKAGDYDPSTEFLIEYWIRMQPNSSYDRRLAAIVAGNGGLAI